ncbi:Gfo/Idh/MocA family oxidoreductase [Nonomuraea turkmeniaca]|nr:Gfo/Idh/MocA family oxidoreductase [Nonomuraea turkmeniaca]
MSAEVRAIRWPRRGMAEVDGNVDLGAPGPGEVAVDVEVSVTSSGTERARFLGLPTADVSFPHSPGYLAAGRVTTASPGLPEGTRVALRDAPHQSRVVVPARAAHPVPEGVTAADAALWQLGLTAMHGLAMGGYRPGEPVAVVGAGLLGIVARRIAAARGSSLRLAVAASDAKAWAARREEGTLFRIAGSGTAAGCPLVLDVTGTPEGLAVAVASAADGGRVVVLGSPRASLAPMPAGALYERGLSLVGAHIATLAEDAAAEFTAEFFAHLAGRRLAFSDVLVPYAAGDAPMAYRRLASDRSFVGAVFEWRREAPVAPAAVRRSVSGRVEPLRYGLAGCGDIGMTNGQAVAGADQAELVACYDPVRRLAEDVARHCGGRAVASMTELLERGDVDAVIVATPHDMHEPLAVAALDAGKHVLLEKPVAVDLPSALRVADAARAATGTLGMLFPLRLDRRVRSAAAAIRAGLLGAPTGAVSTYLIDKPPSYFYGGFSHRVTSTWRMSRARAGGGFLMMNVIHHLDVLRFLLGCEADDVFARTLPSDVAPEVEDLVSLMVRFGDAVATLVGSASVVGGPGSALRVWGKAGHVEVLPRMSATSLLAAEDVRPAETGPGESPSYQPSAVELKTLAVNRFAVAVRRGERPDVEIGDGIAVQAMIEAAYGSAASGRPVSLASVMEAATPSQGAPDPAAPHAV